MLRDLRWLASISCTDIHSAKKNGPSHPGSESEEAGIEKQEVKIEQNNSFARSASSAVKSYSFPTIHKLLLAALIAVPICYYFALIVGAATYPGYSHVTRYASELGAADAPYPTLFNVPIIIGGVAAVLASIGVAAALRDLSGRWLWASLAGAALACWGASMMLGGMFPMPHERHGGFGLGQAGPLVPLFALVAIRKLPDAKGMKLFLGFIFVGSVIVLAIMFGVGHMVTRRNVGIWQRINTGISIPWFAVLGAWLLKRDANTQRAPHLATTGH